MADKCAAVAFDVGMSLATLQINVPRAGVMLSKPSKQRGIDSGARGFGKAWEDHAYETANEIIGFVNGVEQLEKCGTISNANKILGDLGKRVNELKDYPANAVSWFDISDELDKAWEELATQIGANTTAPAKHSGL